MITNKNNKIVVYSEVFNETTHVRDLIGQFIDKLPPVIELNIARTREATTIAVLLSSEISTSDNEILTNVKRIVKEIGDSFEITKKDHMKFVNDYVIASEWIEKNPPHDGETFLQYDKRFTRLAGNKDNQIRLTELAAAAEEIHKITHTNIKNRVHRFIVPSVVPSIVPSIVPTVEINQVTTGSTKEVTEKVTTKVTPSSTTTTTPSSTTIVTTSSVIYGYVYFITEVPFSNKVKIGMSINPEKRVKALQTGNSSRLIIRHMVKSHKYKELEKSIHSIYKDRKIINEWFTISEPELIVLITGW